MKTATLTFQSTNNYGAALQCYALQKALTDLGIENDVIDYASDFLNKPYKKEVLKEKGFIRYCLGNAYALIRSPRNKKFKEFRSNLKLSEHVTKCTIDTIEEKYDKFIVGSDQVWNGSLIGYDDTYFLKFVHNQSKKLSYSASFGFKTVPSELEGKYKSLLDGFDYYCVRESTGVEIIDKLLGKKAYHTIDPTLLLKPEDWENVMKAPQVKDKYILVYQIEPSKHLIQVVENLRLATGYRVIAIPFVMGAYPKAKSMFTAGPAEWIGLFRNAEYIVTDSFHGTAFSTLFNKKFWSCVDKNESRKTSFLNQIGLENRLIYSERSIPSGLLDDIDFTKANTVLFKERKRCLSILKEMVLQDGEKK